MFYWIYDIPNAMVAFLFCTFSMLFAWSSVLIFRPFVRRYLGPEPGANDLIAYFVSAFGVFYGLLLGLIAVGSYTNFCKIDDAVGGEAATLAALYNDVSVMPDSHRERLQQKLRAYADRLVYVIWPDQRTGIINQTLSSTVDEFYRDLLSYEPTNKAMDNLQKETIYHLNKLLELRRERINSVMTSLHPTFYYVVVIGAVFNLWLCCMFSFENLKLQLVLISLLAIFIGLVIFLIAVMDNPFRGEFSVQPTAFKLLLDGLMTPEK